MARSYKNKNKFKPILVLYKVLVQLAQNHRGQQSPQRNDVFCDGLLRVLNPKLHISPIFWFDLGQEHLK